MLKAGESPWNVTARLMLRAAAAAAAVQCSFKEERWGHGEMTFEEVKNAAAGPRGPAGKTSREVAQRILK